jgi:hypothetical protein
MENILPDKPTAPPATHYKAGIPRKHDNILKRQLIHVGAFNLSLIFRRLLGAGTPREWYSARKSLFLFLRVCDFINCHSSYCPTSPE